MELSKSSSIVLRCSRVVVLLLVVAVPTCSGAEYQALIPGSLPPPLTIVPHVSKTTDSESESLEALSQSTSTSFSVDLHHVDALPSSSANVTSEDLFKARLDRDARRVKHISAVAAARTSSSGGAFVSDKSRAAGGFSGSIISGLSVGSGEYFVRLGVGTPPANVYLVLDTGSDINWMQCIPCHTCYNQSTPIFVPTRSATYRRERCLSTLCRLLDSPGCSTATRSCLYQVSYGDGSFTVGEFATETLSFRRRATIPNVPFGCGHDNQGLFVGAAGLLGLGRGPLSLPSRVGANYANKFSYCLVDRSASRPSSLMFGAAAVSRKSVFTPLVKNDKLATFYYVQLTGISVAGVRVPGITASLFRIDPTGEGGVIVDSGTSVTRLVRPAYLALRNAFRAHAHSLKTAPAFSLFDTCFDLSGQTQVLVPKLTLHFVGADLALPASNYLIPVDSAGTLCFAFAPTASGLSIIGNIQQQGFRVSYDLAASRVGFAPASCA